VKFTNDSTRIATTPDDQAASSKRQDLQNWANWLSSDEGGYKELDLLSIDEDTVHFEIPYHGPGSVWGKGTKVDLHTDGVSRV